MTLTIPHLAIRDKTTNNNYERSLTQLFHNLQKYISLTLLRTLEKLCKKRDHGMVDLQPFFFFLEKGRLATCLN